MKAFRCGDVVPGCSREFLGTDRDDILAQVVAHGRGEHRIELDEGLIALVEANLRDAPDPGP